jgi:hypothetical protein
VIDAGDPTAIGPFVVLRKLGEGAMGVVYAGYDVALDRKVAIKLVHRHLLNRPQVRTRMVREAQAMARLSSPYVVQVFQVGDHGDRFYLAMELIDGVTLRSWLKATRRPWRQVLRVFCDAGRGLAAAHAAGLVHRDFKPESTPPPTRTPISQQIGCNPTNSGVLAGGAFFPEGLRVPAVCPEPGKNQAKLSVSTRWCRRGR